MELSAEISTIRHCRISGSENLVPLLELGPQPLANSLKGSAGEVEEKYPLGISFCPDSSLLQLNETVPKEILFREYVWVTGTAATTRQYAEDFSRRAISASSVAEDDLIVEIASNDGTFLHPFVEQGYRNVLGVDPAENIVAMANQRGIRTIAEFWDKGIADHITNHYGYAKLVVARNVIPHVSELLNVIGEIAAVLRDDGIGIIEFHDAAKILDQLHYDSIYHEHLCYFSIRSMSYLLQRFGLTPFHLDQSPISGGSHVIYFAKADHPVSGGLEAGIAVESENGVNETDSWHRFAARCREHKSKTLDMMAAYDDKKVVGFGSSARSQTYLNYCGLGPGDVGAIIDNNPMKQGKYAPGSSIPIVAFDEGMAMDPDLIFVLAWNFRDEIVREVGARGYGGEFLLPFPNEPYFHAVPV